jgi:hypothetical protein
MAVWPLSAPNYIRLDLFPANVSRPPGSDFDKLPTDRARVIITDRDFYVFMDSSSGPECVLSGVLFDATGDNRTGYTVTLEDDTVYSVSRSTNCGCGSRLRGFTPFPGVPYQRF